MQYITKKLCAVRIDGVARMSPSGTIVDIADKDVAKALLGFDAIEKYVSPDAEAPVEEEPMGDLDADSFAQWVAAGAKVGEVADWIGENADRAEIAISDGRATVQKHIEALLDEGKPADDAGEGEKAAPSEDS